MMDRSKIVELYRRWLTKFDGNPQDFSEVGTIEERAERCADYFLELLAEVEAA